MDKIIDKYLPRKEEANVGLFCDCFPPVMDGVAVCIENYAKWIQKMAGEVKVITPNVPGAWSSPYFFLSSMPASNILRIQEECSMYLK